MDKCKTDRVNNKIRVYYRPPRGGGEGVMFPCSLMHVTFPPLFPKHFSPKLPLHAIVHMSMFPWKKRSCSLIPPNPWGSALLYSSWMTDCACRFLSILVIQSELSTLLIAFTGSVRVVVGSRPCHVTSQYPNISTWLITLSSCFPFIVPSLTFTFSSRSFVSLSISSPALWRQKQSETTVLISTTFHSDSESTSNIQYEN